MTCSGYGDPILSDPPIRRRARLRQAMWRVDVLGVAECQPRARQGGTVCVGSELPHTPGAEAGRANYLSDEAFRYAMERLAVSKAPGSALTILEGRLRFNMLSSQPMCFNLFADVRALVRAGDTRGTAAVRAMFPEVGIETVEGIDVEEVPTPIPDYLADRTGWDAAIWINQGTGPV